MVDRIILPKDIEKWAPLKSFSRGDTLLEVKAEILFIPIVKTGKLAALKIDDYGLSCPIYFVSPGQTCLMTCLGGFVKGKSKVKLVVIEQTEVLQVPVAAAELWVKKQPDWFYYLSDLYNDQENDLQELFTAIHIT